MSAALSKTTIQMTFQTGLDENEEALATLSAPLQAADSVSKDLIRRCTAAQPNAPELLGASCSTNQHCESSQLPLSTSTSSEGMQTIFYGAAKFADAL
ncbi:hypothetical protein GPL17_37035 [Bradyrhizobium yuanmingense]|uniref:hypothetical protein n=1 Tax=Bradyrhizobium yuanmingense TaxID=108015 RepID=UPI0012F86783|nr:hypothetical protein [Bradyrhizobium yuanmingense]MVT55980.1 hypothetical protein [Bradyrhizobium yuanmingense]